MLEPTSSQTVGDESKAVGTFKWGSAGASVTSPSLYNVYMDSFPCSVIAEEPRRNNPVIIFADDVQLRAKSREGLQALLDQAATWVVANDMTRNVAKCSIICMDANQGSPLILAGEMVQEVTEAEYRGVTMTVQGITDHHFLNRMSNAKKRLNQLKSIGLKNTGSHPPTRRRSNSTLARSMTEYQIHLTPCTNTFTIAYQSLENEFFSTVGGFKWRKAQCWRKGFKLQHIAYHRARLRDNLRSRLSREERLS